MFFLLSCEVIFLPVLISFSNVQVAGYVCNHFECMDIVKYVCINVRYIKKY